jgi:asparagine synthase (glutamine-hydrolysing)
VSALAVVFRRDGETAGVAAVLGMLAAMAHRGPDGQSATDIGSVALGTGHFWTTPEELGEHQPLADNESGFYLVWDGRIDNRAELYRQLGSYRLPSFSELSDARLFLAYYARFREKRLAQIVGEFVFAVYDLRRREVIVGRDVIGVRCVFYLLEEKRLVVASEECGVLAHPDVELRPCESALVSLFGDVPPGDGTTIYKDVYQLLPGHLLKVGARSSTMVQYATIDPNLRIRYRTDRDYAEHFRHLLEESVTCRLRCVGRPASSLSGGLDSAPITALAAHQLQRGGSQKEPLAAISWVFDEHSECDERRFFAPLYDMYRIQPLHVNCDDAWPLSDFATWPVHVSSPFQDAYRQFHERSYRIAHAHGIRVVLSGMLGDLLYLGYERWFLDLLADGKFKEAAGETKWYVRKYGWRPFIKRQLARPIVPQRLLSRRQPACCWLTDRAREMLAGGASYPANRNRACRPRQFGIVLDLQTAQDTYIESYFAARHGIECRYPFRDRRLVEFLLAVPTSQLYRRGVNRPIMRHALAGLLPEEILRRDGKTSFQSVFDRGLFDREKNVVQSLLDAPGSLWQYYVNADWLRKTRTDEKSVVMWNCVSFELWCERSPLGRKFKHQLSDHVHERKR